MTAACYLLCCNFVCFSRAECSFHSPGVPEGGLYRSRYEFRMRDCLTTCEVEFTHLGGRCSAKTDSFRLVIAQGRQEISIRRFEIKVVLSGLYTVSWVRQIICFHNCLPSPAQASMDHSRVWNVLSKMKQLIRSYQRSAINLIVWGNIWTYSNSTSPSVLSAWLRGQMWSTLR